MAPPTGPPSTPPSTRKGVRPTKPASKTPKSSLKSSVSTTSHGKPSGPFTPEQNNARSVSFDMKTPQGSKRSQSNRELTNSDEKANIASQPPVKKLSSWKYEEGVLIGHHKSSDKIRIRATVDDSRNLLAKASKADAQVSPRFWDNLFVWDSRNAYPSVDIGNVQISQEICNFFPGDLNSAPREQKIIAVLKHLGRSQQKSEAKPINEEASESMSPTPSQQKIHVQPITEEANIFMSSPVPPFPTVHRIHSSGAGSYILKNGFARTESPLAKRTAKASEAVPQTVIDASDTDTDTEPEVPLRIVLGSVEDDGLSKALQSFQNAAQALANEVGTRERAVQKRDENLTRKEEQLQNKEEDLKKREKKFAREEDLRQREADLAAKQNHLAEQRDDFSLLQEERTAWFEKEKALKEEKEARLDALEKTLKERDEKSRAEGEERAKASRDSLNARMEAFKKKEEAVKQREDTLNEREAAITSKKDAEIKQLKEDLTFYQKEAGKNQPSKSKLDRGAITKQDAEIKKLKEELATYKEAGTSQPFNNRPDIAATTKQTTAELEKVKEKLGRMSKELEKTSKELASYKSNKLENLRLDGNATFAQIFDRIPDGQDNAGMYREKRWVSASGKGPYVDKKFDRFRVVQVIPTVKVDGELVQKGFDFHGTKYSVYKKDGVIKLVQEFDMGMLRQHEGKILLSTTCLKEKTHTV